MEVYEALTAAEGSLPKARRAVSMIVGRDTENLDREGVIRAAVETVAENTADGVIAPLFYLALGGAVGGMAYKAINTMDSMLGYKNERYQYFGTAAARLDDAAGFIPARLSGLLLVAAAGLTGMDAAGAWRIFCRDRYAHKSPNSAQSESAVAGALGVQLAGDAVYGGMVVHKPTIGDHCREIEAEDIPRACRLMYTASGLGLGLAAVVLAGVAFWG
jgi:adenosylcobinamide-phosphate synthase